jgi:hypothetical protein
MSVRVTTPIRRPERTLPVIDDAGTAGKWVVAVREDVELVAEEGTKTVGPKSGVAGAEGEGEGDSTTHMRCDLVATNLATVWASEEYGLT